MAAGDGKPILPPKPPGRLYRAWDSDIFYSYRRSPVTIIASVVVVIIVGAALLAPWIAPYNPFNPASLNLMDGFTPPFSESRMGNFYLLGTDNQGRDVLSTILYGSRISLFVGFAATLFAMALGIFMGPAQAASRTLMARMAPEGEITSHFGLFALSGRITGFLGPAVLAAVTAATGSQRAGMATVLVFLSLGAAILATVRPVRC
ncbi:MAG: MFS transporter [Rhizobiaceae bacterium]|nr:MFS transporter [Rhizobiaceae bacterium]